jgi:hypothetical protein
MGEKYYTPEISEFHVGFEYENFVKHKGWTKRVLENLASVDSNEDGLILDYDDYRVKRLDKEDIISLGIPESSGDYDFSLHSERYTVQIEVLDDYLDSPDINITYTIFEEGSPFGIDKGCFFGKIKNKSELKRILTQLGIEN